MAEVGPAVLRLGAEDAARVVDVLRDAFFDYPLMRFVLGPERDGYPERLATLVGFFVMTRVLQGEVLLGVGRRSDLDAAAMVSRPSRPGPPEVGDLRERVWAELGDAARSRYEAFGAASAPFQTAAPHLHLNMIGVRPVSRGRGHSRVLIEHVHLLSRTDPESTGVTLTTEDPANVALYRHFGYEVVGHARVAPELETWGFFRPDRSRTERGGR